MVRKWDVGRGLPFDDGQVVACYASHVLEHLTRATARRLILECVRVLKPGGIILLVVPDLEAIARQYLACLDRANQGAPNAENDYEWMVLELID